MTSSGLLPVFRLEVVEHSLGRCLTAGGVYLFIAYVALHTENYRGREVKRWARYVTSVRLIVSFTRSAIGVPSEVYPADAV